MTNSIDSSWWKEFKVSDIFEKVDIKKYSKTPDDAGKIPFVSSTSLNNGVSCFVSAENIFRFPCLTVSTNGDNFDTFYHVEPIAISSDVEILYNKNLKREHYLFIATLLRLEKKKYAYGRKAKNNAVFDTIIKLPVDQNGNPDWQYMDDYIKGLWARERDINELAQSLKQLNIKLETVNWKEFKIKNIFFAINGKGITSEFIKENNGKIPAIQGGEDNNGILGFLNEEFKKTLVYINQPCLTLARVGTAGNIGFIRDECYIGDKAKALIFKNTELKYNIYCYLFLKTILLKLKYKYSYGRGIRIDRYLENEIMLPVDQDGNPDWQYMENYIKSLPFSRYL